MTKNPPKYNPKYPPSLRLFRLKYRKVLPCTYDQYIRQFKNMHTRRVRLKIFFNGSVSTVFLAVGYGINIKNQPIVFETMVFGFDDIDYCTRCATCREALKQHHNAITHVKALEI